MLGAERQAAGGGEEVGRDDVARVFGQLVLRQQSDQTQDEARADEQQRDAAKDLERRIEALERDADPKDPLAIACARYRRDRREALLSATAAIPLPAAQTSWIGYFAKIASIRLNALSTACSVFIPLIAMSDQATFQRCSVRTWE